MSFRKRLVVFLIVVLLAGALDALFAPTVVARGVRLWIRWAAKSQGLSAEMEDVDAPFLREVTIRNLRVAPANDASRKVSFRAASLVVDLNFRGWIFSRRARLLRSINLDHCTGSIRVRPGATPANKSDWRKLAQLLPNNFRIDHLDFDVVTGATAFSFRGVVLTASAIESGKFLARQIAVTSPVLRQTFGNLRGATSWEGDRLTIAGIPLIRGLDLEALTIDLSHLAGRRLGLDLHLDTYGGTLRASFQGRAREKFAVDVAGSASNLSLAQISKAVGFLEPITGSVRASKFTFRGNPGEFLDATASIWIELTDFAWRARRADNVMLGATFYDRRLEVDQFYVRQQQNELTVNGELPWPKKTSGWARLPFRGQLNAAIPDLNGFAQFFGAPTGDFTGALSAEGQLDSVAPEAHGRLALHGQGVTFRGVALDSLGAALHLKGTEATLENLEVRHAEDFARAQGAVDLAAPHRFSGRLTGAINDLGAYASLLPAAWRSAKIGGGVTFDWSGDGTLAAHSGTMQFFAHGLQMPVAPLRLPLDVTLVGTYSPQDVFFRTFKLASDRVSLGSFLMLGSDFVELQALELTLDGIPRIGGTLFLPISVDRWRISGSLLAALDEGQKFDVDLAINHLDVATLASVLGEESAATGVLDGKLAAFGPLRSLQVTTSWRLENLGPATSSNSIDFEGRYADGRAEAKTTAIFGMSDPVTFRAWLPLQLEKSRIAAGTVIDPVDQFSVAIDCPALFLETLPNDLRFSAESGLVTGNIAFFNTLRAPSVRGAAEILGARFKPPAPWPELTGLEARLRFGNTEAVIEPLRFEVDSTPIALRGRLTTTTAAFGLELTPVKGAIELVDLPGSGADLSTVRMLGKGASEDKAFLREALVRGRIGSAPASLTIRLGGLTEGFASSSQTTLFFHPRAAKASPLLLRVVSPERPVVIQLVEPKP
jgi:hypothetical protein